MEGKIIRELINQQFIQLWQKLEDLGTIVRYSRENSDLNISSIAEKLDTKPHIIKEYLDKKRLIPIERALSFCDLFNISWNRLLPSEPEDNLRLINGKSGNKLKVLYSNIPLRATPYSGMDNERGDFREELVPLNLDIPGLHGELFAFTVSGDSMYPTFEDGDLVFCEYVKNESDINERDPYVFESQKGLYLKRVQKQYNETSQLISYRLSSDNAENEEYKPFTVSASDLKSCMRVKVRLTSCF